MRISVDGVTVEAAAGTTVIAACDAAGIVVPRLCYHAELPPGGECRLCTCKIDGRFAAACTTAVADGMTVENDTDELRSERRTLVRMLFVEGNHCCPTCEKSGHCALQMAAYDLELDAMRLPYQSARHAVDATHPALLLDRNTCVLCGLCIRAAEHHDGKHIFGYAGRGIRTQLAVDGGALGATDLAAGDLAARICPVGCILPKPAAFRRG